MSPIINLRAAGALVLSAIVALPGGARADSKPQCDNIAKDIRASITKEPSKVLMIVEDSLVINESCACEIVKTAISAAHADAALVKEIVQTAVAVAPKMTPIIMECSGTSATESSSDVVVAKATSAKDAKNVQPETVLPPKEESDYSGGGGDLRGVYVMQPAIGGSVVTSTPPPDVVPHKPKPKPKPRHPITPLSPSCTCVDTPVP